MVEGHALQLGRAACKICSCCCCCCTAGSCRRTRCSLERAAVGANLKSHGFSCNQGTVRNGQAVGAAVAAAVVAAAAARCGARRCANGICLHRSPKTACRAAKPSRTAPQVHNTAAPSAARFSLHALTRLLPLVLVLLRHATAGERAGGQGAAARQEGHGAQRSSHPTPAVWDAQLTEPTCHMRYQATGGGGSSAAALCTPSCQSCFTSHRSHSEASGECEA